MKDMPGPKSRASVEGRAGNGEVGGLGGVGAAMKSCQMVWRTADETETRHLGLLEEGK